MPKTLRPIALAIVALVVMAGAYYTAAARIAGPEAPQAAVPEAASLPIDIMQLMREAKDLPVQQYDAH
jgi:hypothetical protein